MVIPMWASHYSKPKPTSTAKIKCVLVSPFGWWCVVEHPLGLSALDPRWRCRGRVVAASAMLMSFINHDYTGGESCDGDGGRWGS